MWWTVEVVGGGGWLGVNRRASSAEHGVRCENKQLKGVIFNFTTKIDHVVQSQKFPPAPHMAWRHGTTNSSRNCAGAKR